MAVVLATYGSWQVLQWGPPSDRQLIANLFFLLVSGWAISTAWSASRRCRRSARLSRAWSLLALGLVGQLAGQVAFAIYDFLGKTPYPSVADVLYLSFYPITLWGLLRMPVARAGVTTSLRLAVDLAVVAIGASALVVYVVLGPTVVLDSGSPLQVAISIAYPAGDMVLFVGIASLLMRGVARSAHTALRLYGSALALFVLGDLVYGYITLHSSYQTGDAVDTTWMVALALMAVAGSSQRNPDGREDTARQRERVSWLPSLAVAFGFGILIFSDRHAAVFPGLVMIAITIVLAALVLARQALVQRDLIAAQAQLRYQALHDALTGLPNRLLVLDRVEHLLARARRRVAPVAVLFLDIDGFKHVNDTFGHSAGDELLRAVAGRLRGVVREPDTVGRMGGDEFVILLDSSTLDVAPELVAGRVLEVLREPIDLAEAGGRSISITASIGIATGQRSTADELLRDADLALYRAKEAGRDRHMLFESGIPALDENHVGLVMDLHDAVAANQFFLVYQPTFDLRSNAVVGLEALLRWRHPSRGVIAPNLFISIAEETGLIIPIGRWVLYEACRQAAKWHRRGRPVGIAVNVSGRQFDADNFLDDVREALERTGLDPAALTLEITETSLMKDAASAAATLASIKTLGVRIAIDDFGTGYSSLAYLRELPVDALKIDRSFISGVAASKESVAIVEALVQLGRTLGLETLGEGIEQPAQLQQLRRAECDLGQGFLLARPLDLEATERFLEGAAISSARADARGCHSTRRGQSLVLSGGRA